MSVRAPAGAMGKTAYNVVLGRGVAAIKGNEFIFQTLVKMDLDGYWKKLAAGSTFESINSDTISNAVMSIPQQVEEQSKIGDLFESVDNLITLHQRKQNGLFLLILGKKSSLILANDWEQRKLGDIGRVAMNRRIFKEQTSAEGSVPFYKIGTFGGEPDAFISDELYQEYKERFPYPKVGDILLSASGSIGKMVEYKGEKAYFQDSNIVWLDHDASVLNVFLKCFYSVVKWAGLEGSTIKRLYNKNILETQIALPSSAEQCLIGDFFEHIDNLITLHQCKGNLVQNKFGLHSPFQMRCKLPDDWEQRKLSEIVSYTASALSAKDVSDSGCYDLYDANSVIGKTNDGVMDHEYITIIKDGAGVGRVRILPAKTAFIGTMGAMTAKNSSLSFVYAMLCSTDLSKRFSGSTIPHIYFKDYGQEQYCVPELCEQDKIAAVFSDIDNLITLHQCKRVAFFDGKRWLYFKFEESKNTLAWEQRKVQDVADRYDNLRIPVAANLRVSGNIPYYGANGIQDYVNGFTHEGEFVLVAEDGANDLKNYPVQHVQGRIWVNNHAHVLQGKPALMNNLFLAYSLHRADIASFLVGGSRAKLNADTLMTLELLLPSVEEQTKIGRNLAAVDNLITLHQRGEKIYNRRQTW